MPPCGFYLSRRQKLQIFFEKIKKRLTKKIELKLWPLKK